MSIFEKFFGGESDPKTPEQIRIEGLESRIKSLRKERERITVDEKGKPKDWGVDPRIEQINQEIENINREIEGKPPLLFHGSQR